MPVCFYRSRDEFMLEHPSAMDKADVLAAEESRKCHWLFDHAIYDKRKKQFIVSYYSPCAPSPDPCILTIVIKAFRGKLTPTVYQKFDE
ncbi:MAG: hypothetical protein ACOYU3_02025 [Bacillota bacterium]